jgi:hypothetical protein
VGSGAVFASHNLFKATSREIAALTRPVNAEASKLQKKANPIASGLDFGNGCNKCARTGRRIPGKCVKTVTVRKTFNAKPILRIDGKVHALFDPAVFVNVTLPKRPF